MGAVALSNDGYQASRLYSMRTGRMRGRFCRRNRGLDDDDDGLDAGSIA